jgi:IS5 family transposase
VAQRVLTRPRARRQALHDNRRLFCRRSVPVRTSTRRKLCPSIGKLVGTRSPAPITQWVFIRCDYGHKLNLVAAKSGLILDLVIEAGNPADRERLVPMLKRHIAVWGAAPRQAAADGGYASRDNLAQAKACGVADMAFHKKAGLRIEEMVRSRWVSRKLRNFRAGIEAGISCLKRAYGLARCTWGGLDHFKAYVWSSVLAYNLALLARLKTA